MKKGYKCSAPDDYCSYQDSNLPAFYTCDPTHCNFCIPEEQDPEYKQNDASEEHY